MDAAGGLAGVVEGSLDEGGAGVFVGDFSGVFWGRGAVVESEDAAVVVGFFRIRGFDSHGGDEFAKTFVVREHRFPIDVIFERARSCRATDESKPSESRDKLLRRFLEKSVHELVTRKVIAWCPSILVEWRSFLRFAHWSR